MKFAKYFLIISSVTLAAARASFASPQGEILQPCKGGAYLPGDTNPHYIIPDNVKECAIGEAVKNKTTEQTEFFVVLPATGEITTSPQFDWGTIIAIEFVCPSSSKAVVHHWNKNSNQEGEEYNCLIPKNNDQYEEIMCSTCSR